MSDRPAAVVTGSSRGLGRSFATALARDGFAVVVTGTDPEATAETVRLIEDAGGTAVCRVGSLVDPDFCGRLVDTCADAFGRVDLLVNNAGLTRDRSVVKMTAPEWDEVLAVHLRGTWACSAAAARAMRGGGGHILSVTSGAGLFGMFGQANYAAAKAGIIGLNRVLEMELGRFGIRCNVLYPVARTRMTAVFADAAAAVGHESTFPPPETVAPVVSYLASPAAAHLHGQVISFDGRRLSVWSHPAPTATWTRELGAWRPEDFAAALTAEVMQPTHPDSWGRGVIAG